MKVKVFGHNEKRGSKVGVLNTEPRMIEPKPVGQKTENKQCDTTETTQ